MNNRRHCEGGALPPEAISCRVGDRSPHWRAAQVSGKEQEHPRNDMICVTESSVTFFLIASHRGDFYLFFMRLPDFFVAVLCVVIMISLSVR